MAELLRRALGHGGSDVELSNALHIARLPGLPDQLVKNVHWPAEIKKLLASLRVRPLTPARPKPMARTEAKLRGLPTQFLQGVAATTQSFQKSVIKEYTLNHN